MNAMLAISLSVLLLSADPVQHVPIHEPSRVFRPDDIRSALAASDDLATIKDIVRKLEGDPAKLERLAALTELAQKFDPERLGELSKVSPALRNIAEKLKGSEFQKRLFDDPGLRRAAERLAAKPEMRELVERLAGAFPDSGRPQQSASPPSSAGPASTPAQAPSEPKDSSPGTAKGSEPDSSGKIQEKASAPVTERKTVATTSPPETGAAAGTGESTSSPLKGWLPELDRSKSRIVQRVIDRLGPEKLLNQALRRSNTEKQSGAPSPALDRAQAMLSSLAERSKGIREWSQQTTVSIRGKLPDMPKMNIPKIAVPKWKLPVPEVPKFSVPQFSMPSGGGGSGFGIGVFVVAGMVGIFVIAWLLRGSRSPDRPWQHPGKRWNFQPRGNDERSKICDLYEKTAVATLGDSVRAQHHHRIAELLLEQQWHLQPQVEEFSQLYEKARYGPEDEPLDDHALEKAIQYSAQLREFKSARRASAVSA